MADCGKHLLLFGIHSVSLLPIEMIMAGQNWQKDFVFLSFYICSPSAFRNRNCSNQPIVSSLDDKSSFNWLGSMIIDWFWNATDGFNQCWADRVIHSRFTQPLFLPIFHFPPPSNLPIGCATQRARLIWFAQQGFLELLSLLAPGKPFGRVDEVMQPDSGNVLIFAFEVKCILVAEPSKSTMRFMQPLISENLGGFGPVEAQ